MISLPARVIIRSPLYIPVTAAAADNIPANKNLSARAVENLSATAGAGENISVTAAKKDIPVIAGAVKNLQRHQQQQVYISDRRSRERSL